MGHEDPILGQETLRLLRLRDVQLHHPSSSPKGNQVHGMNSSLQRAVISCLRSGSDSD